jgi:hypothetical protein
MAKTSSSFHAPGSGGDGAGARLEQKARLFQALLCRWGLVTCLEGIPGEPGARYRAASDPLQDPERYTPEVRRRHAENQARWKRLCDN